jgi:hypothetical protein
VETAWLLSGSIAGAWIGRRGLPDHAVFLSFVCHLPDDPGALLVMTAISPLVRSRSAAGVATTNLPLASAALPGSTPALPDRCGPRARCSGWCRPGARARVAADCADAAAAWFGYLMIWGTPPSVPYGEQTNSAPATLAVARRVC